MSTENHPDDQSAIEKLHVEFINRFDLVNDDLMAFQDKAYSMGRARGLLDAERQVGELQGQLGSTRDARDYAMSDREELQANLDTAMELLVRVQQQAYLLDVNFGFPLHDEIEELINTTSTEGKDHE